MVGGGRKVELRQAVLPWSFFIIIARWDNGGIGGHTKYLSHPWRKGHLHTIMGAFEDEWIQFARAPRLVYLGLRVCHCSSMCVLIFISFFFFFLQIIFPVSICSVFCKCRSKFSVKTADTDCSCCRGVHQSESAPQLWELILMSPTEDVKSYESSLELWKFFKAMWVL